MAIPSGYAQTLFGGLVKSDASGPYANPPTAIGGAYTQLASGFWTRNSDGSGPYFYDVATGVATISNLFRSI